MRSFGSTRHQRPSDSVIDSPVCRAHLTRSLTSTGPVDPYPGSPVREGHPEEPEPRPSDRELSGYFVTGG
jgi:hypothetical protein